MNELASGFEQLINQLLGEVEIPPWVYSAAWWINWGVFLAIAVIGVLTVILLIDMINNRTTGKNAIYLIVEVFFIVVTIFYAAVRYNVPFIETHLSFYLFLLVFSLISFVGSIITFIAYFILKTPQQQNQQQYIPPPPPSKPAKTDFLPRELQKKAELHIFLDNKHVSTFPVQFYSQTIGRNGDIKTPSEDKYVSRRQLQIDVNPRTTTFYLYLLPSKNPVYINGRRFGEEVKSPYILRDGDKIKVGSRTLIVFRKVG